MCVPAFRSPPVLFCKPNTVPNVFLSFFTAHRSAAFHRIQPPLIVAVAVVLPVHHHNHSVTIFSSAEPADKNTAFNRIFNRLAPRVLQARLPKGAGRAGQEPEPFPADHLRERSAAPNQRDDVQAATTGLIISSVERHILLMRGGAAVHLKEMACHIPRPSHPLRPTFVSARLTFTGVSAASLLLYFSSVCLSAAAPR